MSTAPAHGYTEAELALLSDEEREGLLDPNYVDDPVEGEGGADTGETIEGTVVAPVTGADATATATKPETHAAAAAADVPGTDVAVPTPRVPNYQAPADIEQQMQDVRKAQSDLADKFDAGEMTAREYQDANRQLDDKYLDLRDVRSRATLSFDANRSTWENETVATFLDTNRAYEPGGLLYGLLDQEVRRLQTTSYKGDTFNPKILADAHENIQKSFTALTGGKASEEGKGSDVERRFPPTLGHMPTAHEEPLDAGGDFSYIDRLQGVEYEQALERLTPAQYDAYMAR